MRDLREEVIAVLGSLSPDYAPEYLWSVREAPEARAEESSSSTPRRYTAPTWTPGGDGVALFGSGMTLRLAGEIVVDYPPGDEWRDGAADDVAAVRSAFVSRAWTTSAVHYCEVAEAMVEETEDTRRVRYTLAALVDRS